MSESNAAQVILTDDGFKIISVQATANKVAGDVSDINSNNKLTPSEKIKLKQEYDKDVELYNIDTKQLHSAGLPTAELETAMSNLTKFVTPLFNEMNKTSTIDRDVLNSVFTAFAVVDKNAAQAFVNMVQQIADDAKQAGDDAKVAGDNAQKMGAEAKATGEAAKAAGEAAQKTADEAKQAGDDAKTAASQAQMDATQAKADAATAQQKAQSSIDQLSEATTKFSGEITEAKTSASQAQSAADDALSSASSAVAKAESTASEFGKVSQKADSAFDNALSAQNAASAAVAQASSAASDSKDAKQIAGAVSQSYKILTDGSTMTIAELQNGLAAKLTKTDLNGYATQDWTQNQVKMTADGINGTISSVKGTVDSHTTSINNLQADSSSFKSQFTKVNNTLGKQTTDIGTLQASSKELTTGFNTLTTDNTTNKNDISQLKQTATEVSSTLETVQTQVNNSAVGTNLLTGTSSSEQSYTGDFSTVTGWHWVNSAQELQPAVNAGSTYTYSIYLTKLTGAFVLGYWGYDSNKKYVGWTPSGYNSSSGKVSWTFTVPSGVSYVSPHVVHASDDFTCTAKEEKLELGSHATDWCPNPADNATVTAVSKLSQTVDGMKTDISKKIEQKDLNGYATETWAQNQIKTTADGINGTVSSVKSTVNGHTTSINDLKADSRGFKAQFDTVNGTLGKHTTDIGTLQSSSKELSSNFSSLSTDNNTNKNDISELKQTSKEFNSTITTVQAQIQNSAVGTNLAIGTGQEYSMGYGIPTTTWQDGYAYEKLPTTIRYDEILPQATHSFWYSLTQGITYTQTIWLETDATIKDLSATKITWFTYGAGHDYQPAKLVNLGENKYKVYSTYVWPGKSSNDVRLFDIGSLASAFDLSTGTYLKFGKLKLEKGSLSTDWCPNPEDQATKSQITQLSGEIDQKVNSGDFSSYKTQTANLIGSKVDNNKYQSDKTQTANLISQTVGDAINNLNVGGRNYILNSDFYITSGQKNVLSSVEPNEYSGKKITVSVDIEINNLKTIADSGYTRVGYEASFHASDNSTIYVGVWRNLTKSDIGKSFKYRAISDVYDLTKKTITRINNGNGALGGVYIQGVTADSIKVGHPKLEIATKATDWSPAPEDLATNTEFDQLSNAIKLKADSSDVTSQITVATKGIQNEVNNKVSGLNTKISQTSDAVQILNTTSGLRNLVYNSSYTNNAEGWNMFNRNGYLSTLAVSSYNGSPGFGVSISGKGASTWTEFGESRRYTLPQPDAVATENTYSGSAMIKMYDDSDSTAKLSAVIAYYNKNGARIGWKDMFATYDSKNVWKEVKFENFPVPKGAYSIGMQFWASGSKVHGMIAQPMIVFGPKIGPYNPDAVSQSDITASIGNIHLGVKNADGSTSNFNMNGNTILMDTARTVINGKTSILDGTINTAKIANAAINTAQIADGAINNAKIGHLAVNNAQIADGAINSAKISNAAINTAQIADGAINNAKIANAAINDAKISNLNGNKIIARSVTASQINVDDLIANGINTKTLTAVNLNASTLTTPKLDLGLNGTFTEDFDYTQNSSMFLPKKNKGTLTFNHGVLQSSGNMQTLVNGQWGGMNDNYSFQAGIYNSQWTEVAPGYIKLDMFNPNNPNMVERTYTDATGYYYKSGNGIASYLGNVLQTGQVQSPSIITKYIGPTDGELRLQIGKNGNHYGLQVGSYAGNEAVLSDFIYDFTSGASANVRITDNGHLARSTSASKYKYNIKNPDIEDTLGDRLLNVHMATWNDKHAVDSYAEELSTGEKREKISIDKYYGLIAEQLRDAGLDMFVDYGKNHEIEGIQYDRAWIPLLSVIRRLNDKVNEYELRISKLEGANK